MCVRLGLPLLLVFVMVSAVRAELVAYPPSLMLSGPNRSQQLLLVQRVNGHAISVETDGVTYGSASPSIATVSPTGVVEGGAPGETTITAKTSHGMVQVKVSVAPNGDLSFRNHVIPTLTRTGCNSGACHGALAGKGGLKLSLRGYDPESDHFVLTRQALGRRITRDQPEESLLLKKATRSIQHGGGTRFDEGSDHYALLKRWIENGAPGPHSSDSELARLDVFPPSFLLKTNDTVRVIVRAVYRNGTMEDVTRWCKFASTETLVADVNDDGEIKVRGQGEAAITVNFRTQVGMSTVTVPYPTPLDAAAFAMSPRLNPIDDFVLEKLKLFRIPPSVQASDREFIRRVYIDTCGILPTPTEVAQFIADTKPNKRSLLVDRLLERPEYVDCWSYKWSELLLVSSRKLQQPAMWAYYHAIRQSVANNQGWDSFTRDLLTVTGSNITSGLGNFFVIHKDVSDLTETTAVTFLGTSITCSRCHNHPLEKWTQDDYWAFANLFSRIGLKNGDRPGEVIIQSKFEGDALHLRRGVAMTPTPLDGKPLDSASPLDRRRYLADWLTAPDNPYFARAVVNRVWKNFMGRGLVEAEDDLRDTNPPSNRALLNFLTAEFVKNKFDLKSLIRLIVNSAAYQRSSQPLAANRTDDRYYSRYFIRRLPAEVILDAYSDITGVPTPFTQLKSNAGDALTPTTLYPLGTRAMQLPDSLAASRFLESFGRAERVQTCSCERTSDASVTQALHLNNGQTLNDKLRHNNSIITRWISAGHDDATIVKTVFELALSRPPTATELTHCMMMLKSTAIEGPMSRREAIEDLVWAVLTSREFLFNH